MKQSQTQTQSTRPIYDEFISHGFTKEANDYSPGALGRYIAILDRLPHIDSYRINKKMKKGRNPLYAELQRESAEALMFFTGTKAIGKDVNDQIRAKLKLLEKAIQQILEAKL